MGFLDLLKSVLTGNVDGLPTNGKSYKIENYFFLTKNQGFDPNFMILQAKFRFLMQILELSEWEWEKIIFNIVALAIFA